MLSIVDKEADNAFLRRKKMSVRNKFKPTQSATIEEANLLCTWLAVTGRTDEACDILRGYAEKIPLERSRRERAEAACKAMLLLAWLEKKRGNKAESDRLSQWALTQDLITGARREDKKTLFWRHVEGFNTVAEMIDFCDMKHNDICVIYAEHLLEFVYFAQLGEHFEEFTPSDQLMLIAVMTENIQVLEAQVLGM
ncbi:hypothetical protein MWU49_00285 [Alcanivorax sp. S6407]|uniref:hypothetical protein n=1 Tax=Alcanivorax sp. S6407 TaxID=2926424 RepID=UPI001FF28369|nr:hypothetical protein [Alcanivorax sp. S6407]MCK0152128.1 hypothetical protein [Alcanivorax sp. S6407]